MQPGKVHRKLISWLILEKDRSHQRVTQKTSKKKKKIARLTGNGVSFIDTRRRNIRVATAATKYQCQSITRIDRYSLASFEQVCDAVVRNDREAPGFFTRDWTSVNGYRNGIVFSLLRLRENRRWQLGKHSELAGISRVNFKFATRVYRSWEGFLRETMSCTSYRLEFRKSMSDYSFTIYCTYIQDVS